MEIDEHTFCDGLLHAQGAPLKVFMYGLQLMIPLLSNLPVVHQRHLMFALLVVIATAMVMALIAICAHQRWRRGFVFLQTWYADVHRALRDLGGSARHMRRCMTLMSVGNFLALPQCSSMARSTDLLEFRGPPLLPSQRDSAPCSRGIIATQQDRREEVSSK
jgi:hypothetical protein